MKKFKKMSMRKSKANFRRVASQVHAKNLHKTLARGGYCL